MRSGATPPTCSVRLLARAQARSDDPEVDRLEQPLVAPAVHPFTGTFAASEHTVAFGPEVFRLVFPVHVVALALLVCVSVSVVLTLGTVPGRPLTTYVLVTTLLALGLGARIAVHRWTCQAKAQRFGAIAWTIIVACGCTADLIAYVLKPKPPCQIPSMVVYPLFSALFALINASHGMEFWHTASLAGLVLCDFIAVRTVCADSPSVDLAIVALVVTFGAGHFAQLLARHAFLRSEHLRTSRERLEYDVQRLEYRLTGSSTARFPTVGTPAESGKGRPAPDAHDQQAGERSWDQPLEPGAAGPSGLPPPTSPSTVSLISTDDFEPSYSSSALKSARSPNPAAMLTTPLFTQTRQTPPPAFSAAAAAASAQHSLFGDEEQALAGLARRWGAHMWVSVRLLFLGLAAPASAVRLLNPDVLRHIIYYVLLNSGISRAAIESKLAPWAAMLFPVLAAHRLAAPPVQRPRRTLARSLSWSYPARRSLQEHFLEVIQPRLRRSKSWPHPHAAPRHARLRLEPHARGR